MQISMELIDELRKRTNCTYEEAKNLLEKHNGDILKAIIELEKTQRPGVKKESENEGIGTKIKKLIDKGFKTRFIVEKENEILLNLSINVMIVVTIFGFYLVICGLLLGLIMRYKMRIRKAEGKDIDIQKMYNNVANGVKNAAYEGKNEKDANTKEEENDEYGEITIE